MESKVTFLVLDYKKEKETRDCLLSIKKYAKINHQIIYLDNGSNEDYPYHIYKDGLCDIFISKNKGNGGGFGQTDLIRFCNTEYFFFIQNDQELIIEINSETLNTFINLLKTYNCIDLNGNQSNKGIWTDRAHFMKTKTFNDLAPFPNGGPGNELFQYNEGYIQEKFLEKNYSICHISPLFFKNNGAFSIREIEDGIFKHKTDTKQLWIIKTPTKRSSVFPPFSDEEWNKVINNQWVNGDIPIKWLKHSFKYWNI